MTLSSLPPTVEMLTIGSVAVVFVSALAVLLYRAVSWKREQEDTKFEESKNEPQWKTRATNEQGTACQRTAYYGTLPLSTPNSPARHLRAVSAINSPIHSLSPGHIRGPRRDSSPITKIKVVGTTRALSPHSHVIELHRPQPMQPPHLSFEGQQYLNSCDSIEASPRRKASGTPSRKPPRPVSICSTSLVGTSSTATQKFSRCPSLPMDPVTAQLPAAAVVDSKKLTDYSNLYLPQVHKVNLHFLGSVDASAVGSNRQTVSEAIAEKEIDDVLEVSQDEEHNFKAILSKEGDPGPGVYTPAAKDNDI